MKRIQRCKKVNRNNNSIFNHIARKPPRINTITPEMLVGQIWMQEEEPTKSIEIIELNSSDEPEMSPQHITHTNNTREKTDNNGREDGQTENTFCASQDENLSHAWCYVNNDRAHEAGDKHKINKKARDRRRYNIENHRVPTNSLSNIDEYDNYNYSSIYDNISSNHIDEKITLNHQMNYFTILNKHFINSDTSTDSDYDVKMMAAADIGVETTDDWNHNSSYEEEIISYDPNLDKETRTIWIYSFKNKHLLSEDDLEMVNISGKETSSCSTSYSFESDNDDINDKITSVTRISSPIPAIPKLNLSLEPALSTVTEVTESNKQNSSNETKGSGNDKISKPKNSWIMKDSYVCSDRLDYKVSRKNEKSTNIVNWMALSPREKRRRFNDSGDKWKGSILHLGESSHSERTVKGEKSKNELGIAGTVEVKADVHVSDQSAKQRSLASPKRANAITKGAKGNETSQITKDSSLSAQYCDQDRGDHEVQCSRKPQVVVSNKFKINAANITDPIEKLDSCNWIYEERVEKETATYDYIVDRVDCGVDSKIDENDELNVTWIKNTMGLMKPALWTEYLPISNTPLSLHLSLSSIVENKRQSWFKRMAKRIICCK